MKVMLGCLICRMATFLMQRLGLGATTLPGRLALFIKRDILAQLSRNVKVIIITGTNGKTTSARMIEEGIKQAGNSYFSNRSGANLITGITAAFIMNSSVFGRCKKDYAIIECDENAFFEVSRYIHADAVLVTNVFRDQLDRYGEITHTLDVIEKSLNHLSKTVVCLNADCSLTYSLSRKCPHKIISYGVNRPFCEKNSPVEICDAKYCIFCKSEYGYRFRTYGHLGGYYCKNCGYHRPEPEVSVMEAVQISHDHTTVLCSLFGEKQIIKINMGGTYNVYNAMGACSVLKACGISTRTVVRALECFDGAFGRMEKFRYNGNDIYVILVKNPAGFSQTLRYISNVKKDFSLCFCLNDNSADGTDISWIWDVDFSLLNRNNRITHIYTAGRRNYEMSLRLKYDEIPERKIKTIDNEDYGRLVESVMQENREVYIVPTYTAMMKLRPYLAEKLGGKEFWK